MEQTHRKDISIYDEAFLLHTIEKRRIGIGVCNASIYADSLHKDNQEAECFYNSLHISFSRFFRDPVTFAFLEQSILPEIAANKRNGSEIRIWSAGCADGQEAYSLAILLSDLSETCGKKIRFRIFATDICQEALSTGINGKYDENMILDVKTNHLNKYFIRQGKDYIIIPEVRQHLTFSIHDLMDQSTANLPESIYGDFDMVICGNVLIYYKAEVRLAIIRKLLQAVKPGGYLVTGEAEKALIQDATKLHMISIPTTVFKNNIRR